MSQPKNHHYLPVFYLSRWGGKDEKITRYYRPFKNVVASPIKPANTAYEPFLYSFAGVAPDRRQMLETEFFTPYVDTPASKALAVLLDGAPEAPTTRSDWARFLMALRLRNPESLEEVSELSRSIVRAQMSDPEDAEYLAVKEAGDPVTLLEWVQINAPNVLGNAGKMFLPGLIDHEGVGGHIVGMKWGVINFADAERTLLVGDRPFITTHGLKHPACVLALPLSPTKLFVATMTSARFHTCFDAALATSPALSTTKRSGRPQSTFMAPARSI